MSRELYETVRDEELARLGGRDTGRLGDAADVIDRIVLADRFEPFLTTVAYDRLG